MSLPEIHVGIPTLKRTDLLRECIRSLQASVIKPTVIHVIDNGGLFAEHNLYSFLDDVGIEHSYWKPGRNLGVAASWNHLIRSCPDYLVICNDDVVFEADALGKLVEAYDPRALVCPENIVGGNFYSCFLVSHTLMDAVGMFDETISPNYAYLEDCDEARRIQLAGYEMHYAKGCLVDHPVSSTMKSYSDAEMQDHHRRFQLAQSNYVKKWGGLPGQEQFTVPYDGAN